MCLSFLRVCLRSGAHPSQLRSCLSLHSRTISLTTARSPSRHSLSTSPSSSLLPSVYFSQCTFAFKHASFYCFGIVGQEASRTLTSFLLFSPSHLPLGYCRYAAYAASEPIFMKGAANTAWRQTATTGALSTLASADLAERRFINNGIRAAASQPNCPLQARRLRPTVFNQSGATFWTVWTYLFVFVRFHF